MDSVAVELDLGGDEQLVGPEVLGPQVDELADLLRAV